MDHARRPSSADASLARPAEVLGTGGVDRETPATLLRERGPGRATRTLSPALRPALRQRVGNSVAIGQDEPGPVRAGRVAPAASAGAGRARPPRRAIRPPRAARRVAAPPAWLAASRNPSTARRPAGLVENPDVRGHRLAGRSGVGTDAHVAPRVGPGPRVQPHALEAQRQIDARGSIALVHGSAEGLEAGVEQRRMHAGSRRCPASPPAGSRTLPRASPSPAQSADEPRKLGPKSMPAVPQRLVLGGHRQLRPAARPDGRQRLGATETAWASRTRPDACRRHSPASPSARPAAHLDRRRRRPRAETLTWTSRSCDAGSTIASEITTSSRTWTPGPSVSSPAARPISR